MPRACQTATTPRSALNWLPPDRIGLAGADPGGLLLGDFVCKRVVVQRGEEVGAPRRLSQHDERLQPPGPAAQGVAGEGVPVVNRARERLRVVPVGADFVAEVH